MIDYSKDMLKRDPTRVCRIVWSWDDQFALKQVQGWETYDPVTETGVEGWLFMPEVTGSAGEWRYDEDFDIALIKRNTALLKLRKEVSDHLQHLDDVLATSIQTDLSD